jgi:hypothetical protein
MSKAIKRSPAIDGKAAEQELRRLLDGFGALHDRTLAQLDQTDAALDKALAHFRNGPSVRLH